mmetsp:Transcript_12810/g.20141  ORF Transcript_12810/g.20141 Transcript_12810/m.20141 type:complete len:264 (+) Transcript_12810:97-888(+)
MIKKYEIIENGKKFFQSGLVFKELNKQEDAWNEKLEYLIMFNEVYGHFQVPQRYKNIKSLGAWLSKQRSYLIKEGQRKSRTDMLKIIGFFQLESFCFIGMEWLNKLSELKNYLVKNGNCNVPYKFPKNQPLAIWVKNQKQSLQQGKMELNKQLLLQKFGFPLKYKQPKKKHSWNMRFNQLLDFLECTGHCRVPQRQGSLGSWVHKQRSLFSKGFLKNDRIELLNSIGFEWNIKYNPLKYIPYEKVGFNVNPGSFPKQGFFPIN